MNGPSHHLPECCRAVATPTRRQILAAAAAGAAWAATPRAAAWAAPSRTSASESLVAKLFATLTDKQKSTVAFDWNHEDAKRGQLRSHISNNWRITAPAIKSDFYSAEQQDLIRKIWEGIVHPDWVDRFDRQFQDDMGGFGKAQSIALFGNPAAGPFEFVLSGRHGTVRCDGNSAEHVCFGGPIVYGHAASGYFEKDNHPGNVFWHQAEAANKLYQMLDGKQQAAALLPEAPDEALIGFRKAEEKIPGLAVELLSSDQQARLQEVLRLLVEPFRQEDRDEVAAALQVQGGLAKCRLAYYKADDLGDDGMWDNWRLEGPAFVWHYRGAPHVHVWVNVADSRAIDLNSKNLSGPLRQKNKA